MAHPTVEARTRRSQALNQRAASLRRSISPVSSTGSCHGTVVSESTTSGFFSDIEKDIANGDVWNSTGEFFFNAKVKNDLNNSENIRSTAKKHGRWEPRPYQPAPFSTSAIASAFPDFTSIGVDTNEEDNNTTAGKSISLEISRANKPQQYTSNMASSRQSPSRQNTSTPNLNIQHNILPSARLPTPKLMSKTKIDSQEKNCSEHRDKITRSTVHKTINTTSYIPHANRSLNNDRRPLRAFQPRVGDEMDNSIIAEEHTFTTTIASNSTTTVANPLKCPSKTSLPPKSIRFLDSRRPIDLGDKIISRKEGSYNYSHDAKCNSIKSSHDYTPSRLSKLSATHTIAPEPTSSVNPTQTGTSFVLPWNNNTMHTTTPGDGFPVFTAQGKVQKNRLPHEYVDGIDLPPEEEHIYDMIENMNKNCKAEDFIGYVQRKENRSVNGSFIDSVRKRSDSGLGDSGSEMSGRDARRLPTNSTNYENLISELQKKLDEATNSKSENEIKYQQLRTRFKQLELMDKEYLIKIESHQKEKIEMRGMIHRIDNELQRLRSENSVLKQNIDKFKQDILSLESKNLKLITRAGQQATDDTHQISEIQRLRSQIEQLSTVEDALLSSNKELAAKNWARGGEIQDLMEKNRTITTEKHRMESEIDSLKKEVQENMTAKNHASTEITKVEHERKQERSDWAAKTKFYERQINQLTKEKEELLTQLNRSEKCRKFLQANTERIMESTLEIETTKFRGTSKNSCSKKDKASTTTRTTTVMPKENKEPPTTNPMVPCPSECQENNNYTSNSGLSVESDNGTTYSTHSTKKNLFDANTSVQNTLDKSYISNFSDILGHNFIKMARTTADNLEEIVKQRRCENYQEIHDETIEDQQLGDTCQTRYSIPSPNLPSCTVPTVTHRKNSETQARHHTRTFSEHNFSVESQTTKKSIRRHTLPAFNLKNEVSSHTAAPPLAKEGENIKCPPLSTGFQHIQKKFCLHETSNCTVCLRNPSRAYKNVDKVTVRLERPIPVSERMPASKTYEDEPTMRPSVHPGLALTFVMKTISDQLSHMMIKYQETNEAYMKHDSSLARNKRKDLVGDLRHLVKEIEIKQDQIYFLNDALEGLKCIKQEMTEDIVNYTLTHSDIAESTWHGFDK